jgi:uncharacterized protein (TIGR03118 family)
MIVCQKVIYGILLALPLLAQNGSRYEQTNLVSDLPGMAKRTDTNLVNAWGIASSATGPWWVNSAGKGLSLVYNGDGAAFPPASPLIVTVPPAGASEPTGIVFNDTGQFAVGPNQPAVFLFANTNGTISGWNPNANATAAVIKVTTSGAAYTGLTLGRISGNPVLYAANFAGGVEVFNGSFGPVNLPSGAFHDPQIPSGYAPFNVQNIGGSIFVMFAKVAPDGDEEPGPGLGYVDQFTPEGALVLRLEHGSWMNAPWGIVAAPPGFGSMSNQLLVGQFGGGQIASFNPENGKFKGLMIGSGKEPVEIEGLWGIRFGNGGNAGSPLELFFAAGIQDEAHGLFGKLTPATDDNSEGKDKD